MRIKESEKQKEQTVRSQRGSHVTATARPLSRELSALRALSHFQQEFESKPGEADTRFCPRHHYKHYTLHKHPEDCQKQNNAVKVLSKLMLSEDLTFA